MCMMSSQYTLASSPMVADSLNDSMVPTVLILRGWVPGPIYFLGNKLQNEFSCDIIEPPPLLMPPFFSLKWGSFSSSLWCLDLNFGLMLLVLLGLFWAILNVWLFFESNERVMYISLLMLALAFWVRLMAAVVTRHAIADGVEKCLKEMRRRNVVLVIGFSWGAGVLAELLTRDAGLDTRPAFVLLAPVSARIATVAMRPEAAFRLHPLDSNDIVRVIHAEFDPMFCPRETQVRWNNIPGILSSTLQDNHVFKSASSRRALAEIVSSVYRMQTENDTDDEP